MSTPSSPRIDRLQWGRITLADGRVFKDAKLYPGGARAWDWNETGTRHAPGIQMADVQELLDHGAEVVVLSRGQLGQLKVPAETVVALEQLGVEVRVERTQRAVDLYNQLAAQRPVAALVHSTC